MHCPLCKIPMVIKPMAGKPKPTRISQRLRNSYMYCQKCGHGLKDALSAALKNKSERI